jgi:antibiotic biosynthesis monooxygenase (ABM) superfamily enzyme
MVVSSAANAAMLLVSTNVDPAHEDDFNRWYDREHVNERVTIPGFLSGARYRTTRGSRRYLGLYRTTSLAVFETAAYQQALQHPTLHQTDLSRESTGGQ